MKHEHVQPGLWRHYKGGLYTVIGTVTHHETRFPMVLYVSHTYGGMNVRPVRGWIGAGETDQNTDADGWLDVVPVEGPLDTSGAGKTVARFTYIGPLPSDTPIQKRVT